MPAYITPGEAFVANDLVTFARLNNHVAGLTILPRFITDQAVATTAVIANDYLMFWDAAANAFRKIKLADFFATQLVDQAAGVGSLRTLGTGANQAASGATTPNAGSSTTYTGDNTFSGDTTLSGNNQYSGANTFSDIVIITGILDVTNGRANFAHIAGSHSTAGATIAKNANLGTTGTAALDINASHLCGRITLTPGGTGILLGIQAHITFGGAPFYGSLTPYVMLIPADANAVGAQQSTKALVVASASSTGFDVTVAAALVSGTPYSWNYIAFAAQ